EHELYPLLHGISYSLIAGIRDREEIQDLQHTFLSKFLHCAQFPLSCPCLFLLNSPALFVLYHFIKKFFITSRKFFDHYHQSLFIRDPNMFMKLHTFIDNWVV